MCDCALGSSLVTDWASGDVVCQGCGVVVEGHILDEAPEWTTREHEADRSRVGAPNAVLGTFLDAGGHLCKKRKFRDTRTPREISLKEGRDAVDACVSSLCLAIGGTVGRAARELFELHFDKKGVRSDTRPVLAAAAVYLACKLENVGRELRLVAGACQVDLRALNAATTDLKDSLVDHPQYPKLAAGLSAEKLIDIYLDRLRLPADQRKRVWREAVRLEEDLRARGVMDSGRKPRTLCCGILHVALRRAGCCEVPKKELAKACAVCQQTLDKVAAHIATFL